LIPSKPPTHDVSFCSIPRIASEDAIPKAARNDGCGGLLGIVVTLGLLAYKLAGIKRCLALINNGLTCEKKMRLQ
jgi:hypothetical protein